MSPHPRRFHSSITMSSLLAASALLACGCNRMNGYMANAQGMNYYNRGNYTAARHEFHRAAIEHPANPDYLHNMAMAMQKQGDVAGADQMFRRALTSDPAHQPSYHSLASLMKEQGRTQEAVALLDGWSQSQPYSPTAHVETAWIQRETGNSVAAEQELRQALKMQPNNPTALAHLGQLYQDTGRNREAVALYQRSLTANYNQPQLHSRLASMRPVNVYRAEERMAAIPPMMAAPQMAYAPMATSPMIAQQPGYFPAPMTAMAQPTYAPSVWTQQPVQIGSPIMNANADPAHFPDDTAGLPEVLPY